MKKKPPYVTHYWDRHGKMRWRYRRKGYREAQTTELFGSQEWWAWYSIASNGVASNIGADRLKAGTINSLVVAYYSSTNFLNCKVSTRKTYRGILERYRDQYGEYPYNLLEPRHIRAQMDERVSTPASANNLLKVLRSLMRFAIERDLIRTDPTAGVRMLRYKTNGFHTWTEDEISAFAARWPLGTKQRQAMDLLLYTAQRSIEVRQMTWNHVQNGRVLVRQEKTGNLVDIPMHHQLRASLEKRLSNHLVLIVNNSNKPYSEKGFGNWFKKAVIKAGLPHCSAHGLRKAAARRLAEAGCSAHEIMSITGHESLKEVERYTREASRRILANAAIDRIGGNTNPEQKMSNPHVG